MRGDCGVLFYYCLVVCFTCFALCFELCVVVAMLLFCSLCAGVVGICLLVLVLGWLFVRFGCLFAVCLVLSYLFCVLLGISFINC